MTSRDVGILTTDAALVVCSWNDWLERATGIRASGAIGQPLSTLAPGLEGRGVLHRLEDVLQSGTVQVLSPVFHHHLIPCPPVTPSRFFERMQQHVTIGPLVDGTGRTTGLVITIDDITPRLDRERELAQAPLADGDLDVIVARLRDDDWRVRRATVEGLSQSAAPDLLRALLDELRRNHRNFSALSSALRLLASADHDLTQPLAALLHDPDPDLRMQVALALGELQDPAAAEPLRAALEDPDQNVRFHAIEALGRLRAASAVDALAKIAESDDFFLAFAALDALALIHDPRVATRLVRLLDKPDVRDAAIGMLAAIGDVQVCESLAGVINAAPESGAAAADALVRIHERESARGRQQSQVPAVVADVVNEAGIHHLREALDRPPSRRPALTVLSWLEHPSLAPAFVPLIDSPERELAIGALLALGETGVDHLLACCAGGDDTPIVPAVVAALGRVGNRRLTPALLDLLDRGGPIAAAAAEALGQLADPAAFDRLIARAGDHDPALRQAVVGALNSLGHPDLPARAVDLLRSDQPLERESGARIAGYFGFPAAAKRMLELTEDPIEAVRIAAIEQLPVVDGERADLRLSKRLSHETPRARAAIVRSLAQYESPAATGALLSALEDPDLWVRYYAARSLTARRDPRVLPALLKAAAAGNPQPVRIAAIDALATIEGPEIDGLVLAACSDANADVAIAALRAAGDRRSDAAFTVLQQVARANDRVRASAALEGLARDGSPRAIELLHWVAASTSDETVAGACMAHLGQIARAGLHAGAAVDALLSLSLLPGRFDSARGILLGLPSDRIADLAHALQQPSVPLRQRAVSLLGELRHPEGTVHLVHALDDPEGAVREAAVSALAQLGARHVGERLARMSAEDPSPAVRRAASDALISFGLQ